MSSDITVGEWLEIEDQKLLENGKDTIQALRKNLDFLEKCLEHKYFPPWTMDLVTQAQSLHSTSRLWLQVSVLRKYSKQASVLSSVIKHEY